jgi:hypothetical protein
MSSSTALSTTGRLANVGLSLYPNPTNVPLVSLKMNGLQEQPSIQLELLNVLGQTMHTAQATVHRGAIQQELNLTSLPAGLYLLRVHAKEGVLTKQLLKE